MHNLFQLIRQSPALLRTDLYAFILFFGRRLCLCHNKLLFSHSLYLFGGLLFSTPEEIIASTGQQYCYNNPPSKPTTENRSDFHLQQSFRIRFPHTAHLKHIRTGRQIIIGHFRTPCNCYPTVIPTLQLVFIGHKSRRSIGKVGKTESDIFLRRLQPDSRNTTSNGDHRISRRLAIDMHISYLDRIKIMLLLIHVSNIQRDQSFRISKPEIPFRVTNRRA